MRPAALAVPRSPELSEPRPRAQNSDVHWSDGSSGGVAGVAIPRWDGDSNWIQRQPNNARRPFAGLQ